MYSHRRLVFFFFAAGFLLKKLIIDFMPLVSAFAALLVFFFLTTLCPFGFLMVMPVRSASAVTPLGSLNAFLRFFLGLMSSTVSWNEVTNATKRSSDKYSATRPTAALRPVASVGLDEDDDEDEDEDNEDEDEEREEETRQKEGCCAICVRTWPTLSLSHASALS